MEIIFNQNKPVEFIEEISKQIDRKEPIVIVTKLTFEEFFDKIGRGCAEKAGYQKMIETQMLTGEDAGIYSFIGKMILDNTIPEEYFILSGKGKDKLVARIKKMEE